MKKLQRAAEVTIIQGRREYRNVLYYYMDLPAIRSSLLILEHIEQRANMRSDLYRKLVASLQSLFGRLTHAYSSGGAGNDDRSCW